MIYRHVKLFLLEKYFSTCGFSSGNKTNSKTCVEQKNSRESPSKQFDARETVPNCHVFSW